MKVFMETLPKKRGRKSTNEYYQNKKVDNVHIEDIITIHLPISIDDYNHNLNIDRQIEILSSTPSVITGYTPETDVYSNVLVDVSVKKDELVNGIVMVSESLRDQLLKLDIKKELFDLTLIKADKVVSNIGSDVCCWWCCNKFQGNCINMPLNLKEKVYDAIGIFCSYSCTYSYMKDYPKYSKNIHLLNYMFRDQTGKKGVILDHITPAPPRETLKMFGGPLSIEEFRKDSHMIIVNRYPILYKKSHMEKITKSSISIASKPEKVHKIYSSSKKHNVTKAIIPDNSLSKILGIK